MTFSLLFIPQLALDNYNTMCDLYSYDMKGTSQDCGISAAQQRSHHDPGVSHMIFLSENIAVTNT